MHLHVFDQQVVPVCGDLSALNQFRIDRFSCFTISKSVISRSLFIRHTWMCVYSENLPKAETKEPKQLAWC